MEPPHKIHKADENDENEVASLERQVAEASSRKDYHISSQPSNTSVCAKLTGAVTAAFYEEEV